MTQHVANGRRALEARRTVAYGLAKKHAQAWDEAAKAPGKCWPKWAQERPETEDAAKREAKRKAGIHHRNAETLRERLGIK